VSAESRAKKAGRDRVKGITLYQPADMNGVIGDAGYDLSSDVNDTAYLNSISRLLNLSAGNSTLTSSALCRRCSNNGLVVYCVLAFMLLTSAVL